MEPRGDIGAWKHRHPPMGSLEQYYQHAWEMCEELYPDPLAYYRTLKFEHVTPKEFWSEYIWCVYTSGFNARVVSKQFFELLRAYNSWQTVALHNRWIEVSGINKNSAKYNAIRKTAQLLHRYETEPQADWWAHFKRDYLATPEHMRQLPFIGSVTCHHLARNLGLDSVKPDLHLVRLAEFFEWPDPLTMCSFLGGLFDERIGVVDLILWYAASSWGTLEISRGRAR